MTIANPGIIDAMSVDKRTNEAVLTLIDHLEWLALREHTVLLSEKLNRYFGFVESGEIFDAYPGAKGRKLRINVICRFEPPDQAVAFLEKARTVAGEYDCTLSWEHHAA
jgi:hypothetical protein